MSDLPVTLPTGPPYHLDFGQQAWRNAKANPSGHYALQELVRVTELTWEVEAELEDSTVGRDSSGFEAHSSDPHGPYLSIGGLANLQFARVYAEIDARWADVVTFHTDLPVDAEDAHQEAYEAYLRHQAEWEYSDSQRLDELMTADDYNRFEENQIALDREQEFADEGYDPLGGDFD
jgi:hypothetical protein